MEGLIAAASEVTPARVATSAADADQPATGSGVPCAIHGGHSLVGLSFGLEGAAHALHGCRGESPFRAFVCACNSLEARKLYKQ